MFVAFRARGAVPSALSKGGGTGIGRRGLFMSTSDERVVVRPTPALLARRYFRSGDGKFVALLVIFPIAGLTGVVERRWGLGLAILTAAVLVALVLAVIARTRMEAKPGELLVANVFRTHRVPLPQIADLVVQTVRYEAGAGLDTYRLLVVVNERDAKGQSVTRPIFATERTKPELVQDMHQRVVRALQASTAASPSAPPPSGQP